ncbi:MAG TPA: DUF1127 domain-containing protein [Candidatus Sulfotelmatobacter sp.]|nr:DUF1127 domain-containing protein [Candidatus Sulfotelmatobacter sp.]
MSSQKTIQSVGVTWWRQGMALAPMPILKLLAQVIVRWTRQRQRYSLTQLDDRILRDMGISRAEAENEANKPFWRD